MTAPLSLALRNDLEELERLLPAVEEYCEAAGASAKAAYHFSLAYDELFTNIVSYAYAGTAAGSAGVDVRLWQDAGVLHAEILDDGRPFDPLTEARKPDLDASVEDRAIGGLGIHFVKTFMDGVTYERAGGRNRLHFWHRLPVAGRVDTGAMGS